MSIRRFASWFVAMLVVSLLLAGCGAASQVGVQTAAPAQKPVLSTATLTPLPTPVPTPTPTPAPLQLVVLHTNDNWGETEPCG